MRVYSSDVIASARRQYSENIPVKAICRQHGMTDRTLYYWIDGGPPTGDEHLPPLPRRAVADRRPRRRVSGGRVALVKRIWRTAEAQVRDIEDRLAVAGQEPMERERDARMLAVLVKTLRELVAIDERSAASQQRAEPDDDDPVPRDIDEFRRELARRIDALIASRADAGISGEPQ